jgi:hypothetical protein
MGLHVGLIRRDQLAQLGDRSGQTPPLQACEQLGHADRRVLEVEPHLKQPTQDFVLLIVQARAYERVRMLRLDAMGCQPGREVAQIDGDDEAGAAVDCGGEHVAIVGIRQRELVDDVLVAADESIIDSSISRRVRASCSQVRSRRLRSNAAIHS